MYLMYVDESGDCGLPKDGSPTRYFCLSGVVVHELRWQQTIGEILAFRHQLKRRYQIYLDDELHAAEMIVKPSAQPASITKLKKHERLAIIRNFTDCISTLSDLSIINVAVDKHALNHLDKQEIFKRAWYPLFQRFENTIRYQNFPGPKNADDRGIVFPDNTDGVKLRQYLKSMRLTNKLGVRMKDGSFFLKDEPLRALIEDPVLRDSRESYFVQVADCCAFLLKQFMDPNAYMKKHGGNAYFKRLEPVLCKHASARDSLGIVRV